MINKDHIDVSDEDKFTSTGIKFWRHPYQMNEYKNGGRNTIISTHISPEGRCNLKCSYCSVSRRKSDCRIDLETIQKYILDLKSRGLKAVILTGGGEPTLYPHFNELVQWIKNKNGLFVSLITNGTLSDRIDDETFKCFSWIRISLNFFPGWDKKIFLPIEKLDKKCVLGLSFIYTKENESNIKEISNFADKLSVKYVRFLPDCSEKESILSINHDILEGILSNLCDKRFFHQKKKHALPFSSVCHQSYFRPYLSEEIYQDSGKPGSVYPCDSVVLNNEHRKFIKKYQICSAENVLDFIDGKIKMNFIPNKDCDGCVFTNNIEMLDNWKNGLINYFDKYKQEIVHEEFI